MAYLDNLLAFYKMDESGNNDRVDSEGLAPNLQKTGTGNLSTVTGAGSGTGNATEFPSGTVRLFRTDSYFTLAGEITRTWTGWFKWDNDNGEPGILSDWANAGSGGVHYLLWLPNGTQKLQFRCRQDVGGDINVNSLGDVSDDSTWHFFACGHNHVTDEIFLRLDNEALQTSSFDNGGVETSGNVTLALGNRNGGGAGLDGAIDAVGFWGKQLSTAEMDGLYNSGDGDEPPFTPICWNYSAPYKNSKKRYRVSGPGSFPKTLKVPENVDVTQGLMIDDGVPIDPSRYEVL